MNQILSYIPKASPIHALDARVKLGLLLLFSIALFCMRTWIGLGIFTAILLGVMIASRVPLKNYGRVLLPALAILIFIWVCNSIPFDAARSLNALMYVVRISLVIHGELRDHLHDHFHAADRCTRIYSLHPLLRAQGASR